MQCPCCLAKSLVMKRIHHNSKMRYKGFDIFYDDRVSECWNCRSEFYDEEQMTQNHNAMIEAYNKLISERRANGMRHTVD